MSELATALQIQQNELEKANAFGEKKIKENDFFKDLTDLMENEQFLNFYNKHMNNWMNIKSTVIYMRLYNEFKEKYREIKDKELDKNIIIYLLCKIMRDRQLRPVSINIIDNLLETGKSNYFKELETILNKKNLLEDK
tara:strand:+ start:751 stop:1164 length:414 start_codon:yes stop_codon:yes gene_type:complete